MPALIDYWESSKEFIYQNMERLDDRKKRRRLQGKETVNIDEARNDPTPVI